MASSEKPQSKFTEVQGIKLHYLEWGETGKPDLLLYLLARCVKAAVRYNASGEFNQSPDNRRRGMPPHDARKYSRDFGASARQDRVFLG